MSHVGATYNVLLCYFPFIGTETITILVSYEAIPTWSPEGSLVWKGNPFGVAFCALYLLRTRWKQLFPKSCRINLSRLFSFGNFLSILNIIFTQSYVFPQLLLSCESWSWVCQFITWFNHCSVSNWRLVRLRTLLVCTCTWRYTQHWRW